MRIVRFFFTKKDEAAYISHLDLQRVMARALRMAQVPVWYSQGFNPHIYMSFALPLPLMQQSEVECMDCKTEAGEDMDFSAFLAPLHAALPRGLRVARIAPPVHTAQEIATADYRIRFAAPPEAVAQGAAAYNALAEAPVVRKTKRSEQTVDLKQVLPTLALAEGDAGASAICVRLPAGGEANLNPELLCRFLDDAGLIPGGRDAAILRTGVYVASGDVFH